MRRFLERDGRFDIIAEVENGHEAVAVVNSERPDALVLDLAMPGLDGIQALTQIMEDAPLTRVAVLSSMVPFNGMGSKAVTLGAVGAFDKRISPRRVIKVLLKSLQAPEAVPTDS
jgi:DNA-binding NarL/FixJ family response regulator